MNLIRSMMLYLLVGLHLFGCQDDALERPSRTRLRVVIPATYKEEIRVLLQSGVRDFSFEFDDIDWVNMPFYKGRDAVFAPSLASRLEDTDPDADVFFIDLYRLGDFRPSWLTPLDSHDGKNLSKPFREAFLEAVRLDKKHVYAIPWSAKGNFLFYRKDLVPTPPTTWAGLKEACEGLPAKGVPRTIRFCLLVTWESLHNDLYPLLWSLTEKGRLSLSSPPVNDFLTELATDFGQEIVGGFRFTPPASHLQKEVGRQIHDRYGGGEAVFMINWNNRYRYMLKELAKKKAPIPSIGIAPIPSAGSKTTRWSNIGTWGWIVPRPAENASDKSLRRHRKAMRFLSEVSSQESVAFLSKESGMIPARRDVALPDDLKGLLAPAIVEALEAKKGTGPVRFGDRGSDTFVHEYVKGALQDILMCRVRSNHSIGSGLLGHCARYYEECITDKIGVTESESLNAVSEEEVAHQCLQVAVRRRLQLAQSRIDILQGKERP